MAIKDWLPEKWGKRESLRPMGAFEKGVLKKEPGSVFHPFSILPRFMRLVAWPGKGGGRSGFRKH